MTFYVFHLYDFHKPPASAAHRPWSIAKCCKNPMELVHSVPAPVPEAEAVPDPMQRTCYSSDARLAFIQATYLPSRNGIDYISTPRQWSTLSTILLSLASRSRRRKSSASAHPAYTEQPTITINNERNIIIIISLILWERRIYGHFIL